MNKTALLFSIIFFSCLFFQCSKKNPCEVPKLPELPCEEYEPTGELIITEGSCFPDVMDKYIYPVRFFSEEWGRLVREGEIKEAYQLPDSVLKSISTLGLIRSFIDIPYLIGESYWTSSVSSFKKIYGIYSDYNSVQELLTRKDAVQSLIAFYAAVKLDCYDPSYKSLADCINLYTDCYGLICEGDRFELLSDCFKTSNYCREQVEFPTMLMALEYLFTTQEILGCFCYKTKQGAIKPLLEKYKIHTNYRIITVMTCIMYDDMLCYFDKESLDSIKQGSFFEDLVDDIIAFAESFIK